jgi:hypothetical protein
VLLANAEQLKTVQTYSQKASFLPLQPVLSLEKRGVPLEKKEREEKESMNNWRS